MATSDAQKRASVKWTKANVKNISIGLRRGIDDDIIERLDGKKNRQQYIKELIRADIEKVPPQSPGES